MKSRKLTCVVALILFAVVPTALASTTWYVNGVSGRDSNNCLSATTACKTIRHAIALALSGDSIIVAPATYTENLTIGKSLTVVGSGASTTVIDGGAVNSVATISNTSVHVTLSKVTIRNGHARFYGGGIYKVGTLQITDSIVTANFAGAIRCYEFCAAWGGGIYNYAGATMVISKSTIANNLAYLSCSQFRCYVALGGGIANEGQLTVTDSTVTGNTARYVFNGTSTGFGGGIYNDNGGIVVINSSTISGNTAFGSGGGVSNGSTVYLQNSIVANNSRGNCSGTMTSKGYNLSSDKSCNFNGPGDMNHINPMLGALQNNGGPTQTQALLPGSPAVDAGNPSGCTDGHGHLLKTDQRGMPRPDPEDTGGCDMGAYESQGD